jgi:hypothetical protein
MMHDQATCALIPRMGAFDDPELRERAETVGVRDHHPFGCPVHVPGANALVGRMSDNLHADGVGLLGGLGQLTGVGAVFTRCPRLSMCPWRPRMA